MRLDYRTINGYLSIAKPHFICSHLKRIKTLIQCRITHFFPLSRKDYQNAYRLEVPKWYNKLHGNLMFNLHYTRNCSGNHRQYYETSLSD